MDYEEEQRNEIEALESIYPEEMTILSKEPFHVFELSLASQVARDETENATCTIKFTYNAKYPEEAPEMEITDSDKLTDVHLISLEEHMKELADENLGMVVVFTIVSSVQEKLNQIVEQLAEEEQNELDRRRREVEDAEQKKFEGTRVTVETFMTWKAKFDADMAEMKRHKFRIEESGTKKLTGKELFMTDHAMDDSDVRFLEEGGEVVEVDESLFQDIDDLTLEEGLDDDDGDDVPSVLSRNDDDDD